MEWIMDYKWNNKFERFALINSVYTFIVYRRMVKTFNDKAMFILNEEISKFGFLKGVKFSVAKVSLYLYNEEMEKKRFVEDMAKYIKELNPKEELRVEQKMEEAERWKGLNGEEIRLRNGKKKPGDRDLWMLNPIIKSGLTGGYRYRIYEKSFGVYHLTIHCPKTDRSLYHTSSRDMYGYNGVYGDLLDRSINTVIADVNKVPETEVEQTEDLRKIFKDMGLPTDPLDYV